MANTYVTSYQELLMDFMPRPIRTDREYKKTCRRIEQLMKGGTHLPRAESEMLEVLSLLVERFESARYPVRDASPGEMLAFLMEQRGITTATLAQETGISVFLLTDVLSGRKQPVHSQVVRLAKYFRVSPTVFTVD